MIFNQVNIRHASPAGNIRNKPHRDLQRWRIRVIWLLLHGFMKAMHSAIIPI
ncbi:hypothetical protein HMPREF1569_2818 [Klebsiella oxytoca OK-1]|nr:hypothetical protein HMPREF1569_2818 [Klebsiella oxytoca OK-1]